MKNAQKLLTRDCFRESVFARDSYKCVICAKPAKYAHHIIERRLFPDGGYYIDNGASLCEKHHIEAEMTTLSPRKLREIIGIKKIILPPHLYSDQEYDKWGNPILSNGKRLKGELFQDESVQKILEKGNILSLYTKYIKYPRTYHLPWSPGLTKDDRMMENVDHFKGKNVVATIKMDGENTTLYNDYIHARSVDSKNQPWQSWAKTIWSKICWQIPEDWRICAENLQAKHSIKYTNLPSFLQMFSIWNDKNICLSWEETKEWAELLELDLVPVLYEGPFDEELIKYLYSEKYNGQECEGYVLRIVDSFHYKEFRKYCGKFVRKNHVNTSRHWKWQTIEYNELADEK